VTLVLFVKGVDDGVLADTIVLLELMVLLVLLDVGFVIHASILCCKTLTYCLHGELEIACAWD
jgi:hypothetical protein